jgi:chorismate mutase
MGGDPHGVDDAFRDAMADYRRSIDNLDAQVVGLLQARAAVAVALNQMKRRAGLPVYDPAREAALDAWAREQPAPILDPEAVVRILRVIVQETRAMLEARRW